MSVCRIMRRECFNLRTWLTNCQADKRAERCPKRRGFIGLATIGSDYGEAVERDNEIVNAAGKAIAADAVLSQASYSSRMLASVYTDICDHYERGLRSLIQTGRAMLPQSTVNALAAEITDELRKSVIIDRALEVGPTQAAGEYDRPPGTVKRWLAELKNNTVTA